MQTPAAPAKTWPELGVYAKKAFLHTDCRARAGSSPSSEPVAAVQWTARTWAVPSEYLRGDWRVPMDKLTMLLLAAALCVVSVLALCLYLA